MIEIVSSLLLLLFFDFLVFLHFLFCFDALDLFERFIKNGKHIFFYFVKIILYLLNNSIIPE